MIFKQKMIVVSAPSGTGKTTLNKRFLQAHPDYKMVTSHTSRPQREKEIDGVDYHFINEEIFSNKIENNQMLEWAKVFNNYYGTSIEDLNNIVQDNKIPILEIDVKGWEIIQPKLPNAQSIFIFPPKVEDLWQRLKLRATESELVRWRRLKTARDEIAAAHKYEWFLINEVIDVADKEYEQMILTGAKKLAYKSGVEFSQNLLREFDQANWYLDLKAKYGES